MSGMTAPIANIRNEEPAATSAEGFAAVQVQVDAVERAQHALASAAAGYAKGLAQIADREHVIRHW